MLTCWVQFIPKRTAAILMTWWLKCSGGQKVRLAMQDISMRTSRGTAPVAAEAADVASIASWLLMLPPRGRLPRDPCRGSCGGNSRDAMSDVVTSKL